MNLNALLNTLPPDLITHLVQEYQKLHHQYYMGRWDYSQLNGGRFGEAVLRIIEYKDNGTSTPIGDQLDRSGIINHIQHHTSLPDSIRLTIPKLAALIMDFRNGRNVAHIGNIEVNRMDASFVIYTSNWIMAELIRLEANLTPNQAEEEIKKITERKMPIVEEIGDRLKILNPKLSVKDKILAFCYQKYPQSINKENVRDWCGEHNKTRFNKYLIKLDKKSLIDFNQDQIILTLRGVLWVEKYVSFEIVL